MVNIPLFFLLVNDASEAKQYIVQFETLAFRPF